MNGSLITELLLESDVEHKWCIWQIMQMIYFPRCLRPFLSYKTSTVSLRKRAMCVIRVSAG